MDEIDGGIKGDSGGHRVIIDYLKTDHRYKQVMTKKKKSKTVNNKTAKQQHKDEQVLKLLYSFDNPVICISNTDNRK